MLARQRQLEEERLMQQKVREQQRLLEQQQQQKQQEDLYRLQEAALKEKQREEHEKQVQLLRLQREALKQKEEEHKVRNFMIQASVLVEVDSVVILSVSYFSQETLQYEPGSLLFLSVIISSCGCKSVRKKVDVYFKLLFQLSLILFKSDKFT